MKNDPGNVLLSHAVPHAVPSALRGLTAVFGMGTGVALSLWSPGKLVFPIKKKTASLVDGADNSSALNEKVWSSLTTD